MKNSRGFAPIIIVVIIVLLAGLVYAALNRDTLKGYFETGDVPTGADGAASGDPSADADSTGYKPTVAQFSSAIDSEVRSVGDPPAQESPINSAPADKKSYAPTEAAAGIAFSWTPLLPKQTDPVTYRLRVWQLMQGQNGAQAMRSNKPLVTKELTNSTQVTASGIYTGPCKPPYLCDFIWNVDVIANGIVTLSSEPFTFSVAAEASAAGTAAPATGSR